MKRSFTIIGLGTFGSTLARELSRLGNDVIGIDLDPELVNELADSITQAVVADARDEKALRDLGVHECDVVVVAIGENMEANLLATLNAKGMKKPQVWAEALNARHHQILQKLGADRIVHPEHDMGLRLANTLMYPEVMDYMSLGHELFTVEIRASARLAGQTLEALHLPENDIVCLLLKHRREAMVPPPADYVLQEDDQIVLLGTLDKLTRISRYL
jgi:trk system potassium uptake protein TrkA